MHVYTHMYTTMYIPICPVISCKATPRIWAIMMEIRQALKCDIGQHEWGFHVMAIHVSRIWVQVIKR